MGTEIGWSERDSDVACFVCMMAPFTLEGFERRELRVEVKAGGLGTAIA